MTREPTATLIPKRSGSGFPTLRRPPLPPLLRRLLRNGLDVRIRKVPYQQTVNLGLFFLHGSQHEHPAANGIAHFIEHVAFNPRYLDHPTRTRLDRLLDMGASYDAFTGKEYTRLMMTCAPEQLREGIGVLGAIASRSRVDREAVDTERRIVLQEHAMAFASLGRIHGQLLDHALWGDRSLGLFIMGRRENIERFTAEELEARMRSHYRPERSCLLVAGPVSPERVTGAAARELGGWTAGRSTTLEPAPASSPGIAVFPGESSRSEILMGFPGPPFESGRRPAMELLADVLGGGIKSRLFLELRERHQLVYLVQAYPVSYHGGGYIAIRANSERDDLEAVYELIGRTLAGVRDGGVRAEELARAKAARMMRVYEAADNPTKYLQLAGRRCILGEDFSIQAEAALISAVELSELRELAAEILRPQAAAVVVLGAPEDGLSFLHPDPTAGADPQEVFA